MSALCRKIINDSSSVKCLRLLLHRRFKRTENEEKRKSFVKDGSKWWRVAETVIIIIKRFSVVIGATATAPKRRKEDSVRLVQWYFAKFNMRAEFFFFFWVFEFAVCKFRLLIFTIFTFLTCDANEKRKMQDVSRMAFLSLWNALMDYDANRHARASSVVEFIWIFNRNVKVETTFDSAV